MQAQVQAQVQVQLRLRLHVRALALALGHSQSFSGKVQVRAHRSVIERTRQPRPLARSRGDAVNYSRALTRNLSAKVERKRSNPVTPLLWSHRWAHS